MIGGAKLRRGAAVLLLAACACNSASESRRERSYEEADAALRKGQLQAALDLVDRALEDQPPPLRESPPAWRLRLLRAEILISHAKIPEALAGLATPLPPDASFDQLRIRQRYLTAKVQVAQGALNDARATLAGARSGGNPDRDLSWDIAILEGQIGLRVGKWAEAETSLNAVAVDAERAGDRYRQALAFNNLGMGRLVRGRFDDALSWFERILAISAVESFSVYGVALNNAGICYARLGQFDRAVIVQQRAVDFHKNGSRVAYQQAVGELGTTYLLQGDHARGLDHLRQALAIASEANLKNDAAIWARNLAAASHDLGRWDDAERFNNQGRQLAPSVLNTLHDAHIAAGRRRFADAGRLFHEAMKAASNQPAVDWSAHAGLAALAVENGQLERAEKHFESALATVEKTRSDLLRADSRISFLNRLIDFYRDYVDFLVSRGRIEQALEVVESSRARVLAERHGVISGERPAIASVKQLAAQSHAVLLSYWLAPSRSYVWTVTAGGVTLSALPPAPDIEQLVDEHQTMLQNALADPMSSASARGDRLYEALIKPVASSIPHGASVIIVPDGALHRLNFETLPVSGARRHYWIEDAEVQVAPSLSLLALGRAVATSSRNLLIIGDAVGREPDFPALRYARDEMAGISKRFEPSAVATYKGAQAAPAAYRDSQPNRFSLIHFTAHATANLNSPLDSAVILSGPDHAYKLYARDIAEQKLTAELVTVSACRSAGARSYSGEGLVGFAWAFLRAGARRVVAGLWDVDDRSTAELMETFYAAMDDGMTPARALREAKLRFLGQQRTYARPYYWGAFQVFTLNL